MLPTPRDSEDEPEDLKRVGARGRTLGMDEAPRVGRGSAVREMQLCRQGARVRVSGTLEPSTTVVPAGYRLARLVNLRTKVIAHPLSSVRYESST